MNLLLLTPDEAAGQPTVLTDRRATHIVETLRAKVGDTLRAGILNGPTGLATVRAIETSGVTIEATCEDAPPPPGENTLLLAVPRPIVLRRCLASAAALGYGRIALFRTRHVDKSHLGAKVMEPANIREHLIDGLSQARRTHVPEVQLFPRFKPIVEDEIDGLAPKGPRFVAHPDAERDIAQLQFARSEPFTVALGPERGFTDYEVDLFTTKGFEPIHTGRHPLRVETALAVITGQLDLLRRI
jgi:RsmE family RNA methyltransferase